MVDISNLLSKTYSVLDPGSNILFGKKTDISSIDIPGFKRLFHNIPTNLNKNRIRKTNEISYGYTNYAGAHRKTVCSMQDKLLLVGNRIGYDINIPDLLCTHTNDDSKLFYEVYIRDILSLLNNILMENFPEIYCKQNDKIFDDFKINCTCFTKVTIRVSDINDPPCPMHTDRSNCGYACILILSLDKNEHFSGGEQVLQIGTNVFKLKCCHGDIFIGEYHNLLHGVLSVKKGIRCAIIAYTSKKIISYCRLRKMISLT